MSCRSFNGFSLFIVTLAVEHIRNEIQGILVVLYFCVEAGEIESVGEVVFVDIAEVFIASRVYELD